MVTGVVPGPRERHHRETDLMRAGHGFRIVIDIARRVRAHQVELLDKIDTEDREDTPGRRHSAVPTERIAASPDEEQCARSSPGDRVAENVASGPVRLTAIVEGFEYRRYGCEEHRRPNKDRIGGVQQWVDILHPVADDA